MGNGVGTENPKKDNNNSINGKLENNETRNSKPNDDIDKSNTDDKDNTDVCENNSIDSSETNKDKECENKNKNEKSRMVTQEPRLNDTNGISDKEDLSTNNNNESSLENETLNELETSSGEDNSTPKCGIINDLEQPPRNEGATVSTLSESNVASMDLDKPRENMTSARSTEEVVKSPKPGETLSVRDTIQRQEASKRGDVHDISRSQSEHSTNSNSQLILTKDEDTCNNILTEQATMHANLADKLAEDSNKTDAMICYLCKRLFKDPRLLPCYHTFCCRCLVDYVMSNYNDNNINCPLCKTIVTVPDIGAKGFENNIYLQSVKVKAKTDCGACRTKGVGVFRCKECEQVLCKECNLLHSRDSATKGHFTTLIHDLYSEVSRSCKIHPEKDLFLFCVKCKSLICEICNIGKHKLHETQDIDSLSREIKHTLLKTIKSPEYSANTNDAVSHVENEKIKVRGLESEALSGIEEHADLLCSLVLEMKSELRAEVMTTANDFYTQLELDSTEIDKLKISVNSRFHFGETFLYNADNVDVVNRGARLNNYLHESLQDRVDLKPTKNLKFIANKAYYSDIGRLFGKVYPSKSGSHKNGDKSFQISNTFLCSLGNCIVTGISPMVDGTVWICLGNDQVIEHCSQQGTLLSSTDIYLPLDDIVGCKDGKVFISCNSGKKIITINTLGNGKTFIRTDYCTRGLALDEKENCMVCLTEKDAFFDTSSNVDSCVSCVSSGREIRTSLRSKDIQYPARIAINNDQSIVISDWIQLAVFVFKNNEEVGCYKGNPDIADDFIPRGICCTADGDIIVVDISTNCLQLLSYNGAFKRVLSELETIEAPWSVAVDGKNNLWIGTQNGQIHMATLL